jgi:hypothetical protein
MASPLIAAGPQGGNAVPNQHYYTSVEASLNESDIIVALANYTASFNGNPCEGISPRRGPEASSID